MLDLKKMLNNLQDYKIRLKHKGFDLDEEYFLGLTNQIYNIRKNCQDLQNQRNTGSSKIGKLVHDGASKEEIEKARQEMTSLSDKVKEQEAILREKEEELHNYMMYMPNVYDDTTPIGKDDSENVVVAYYGKKPEFDFTPKEH